MKKKHLSVVLIRDEDTLEPKLVRVEIEAHYSPSVWVSSVESTYHILQARNRVLLLDHKLGSNFAIWLIIPTTIQILGSSTFSSSKRNLLK